MGGRGLRPREVFLEAVRGGGGAWISFQAATAAALECSVVRGWGCESLRCLLDGGLS